MSAGADGEVGFLEVRDATVRYRSPGTGWFTALDGVDLTVNEGEAVAVVGPSGCGKSTLLRSIAGLEPLASGRVSLADRDLAEVPTHQRDLGLMFQHHALFPHLDVADNIGFGLRMQGVGVDGRSRRVAELLELVGLGGYGSRRIDQLSGGEAQRVALARALAPSPGLLMLDEPLGSLDRVLREQLTADLRSLIVDLGLTALHVTHDQAEANAVADRIVVLDRGRIEQVGTPTELWHRPASVFVAEFLGHPNLWRRDGGVWLVPVPALRLVDSEAATTGGRSGRRTAAVERVEFQGGRHRVTARSDDDQPGEVVVFEASVAPERGARVEVVIDLDRTQLLPDG